MSQLTLTKNPVLERIFSETDKAYLAGLVDGEGCITIGRYIRTSRMLKRKSYNYEIKLGIGMTYRDAVGWVHDTFDGILIRRKRQLSKGRVWYVQFTGASAIPILKAIYPYLKLKRPQATIVIAYHYNKKPANGRQRYYGVPCEEYLKRNEYWKLVHSCNAKERWKKRETRE